MNNDTVVFIYGCLALMTIFQLPLADYQVEQGLLRRDITLNTVLCIVLLLPGFVFLGLVHMSIHVSDYIQKFADSVVLVRRRK